MLLAVVVDWTFTPGGLNFYAHLLFCMLNFCGWSQPRNYFNSEIFPLCVINYVYHVRLHTVHVCVQHHVRLHMCIHLYVCATFDLKHICMCQMEGCMQTSFPYLLSPVFGCFAVCEYREGRPGRFCHV